MLKVLFSRGTCIAHAFYGAIWTLICLPSPKLFQNVSDDFKIHQLHKKSSYKMISSNLKIYITNTKQNFKIITFLKKPVLLAVFSLLFIVTYFFTVLWIVKVRNRIKLFYLIYQLVFSQLSPWTCHR